MSFELKRPSAKDTEEDLLQQQEEFLKQQGKRHIDEDPDANVKKTCMRDGYEKEVKNVSTSKQYIYAEDDAEERLERDDVHITKILSAITEKDYSAVGLATAAKCRAVPGGFPVAKHRLGSGDQAPCSQGDKKKSIFARQFASYSNSNACDTKSPVHDESNAEQPLSVSGNVFERWWPQDGNPSSVHQSHRMNVEADVSMSKPLESEPVKFEVDMDEIRKENERKLSEMGEQEIRRQQQELLQTLDPSVVQFLKSRGSSKLPSTEHKVSSAVSCQEQMEAEQADVLPVKQSDLETVKDLPLKPKKEWLRMDKVEPEKLSWMKDLPVPSAGDNKTGKPARFDFEGKLVASDADLPVHLGLHHHGQEPERAGYSLEELFQLSRSSNIPQRSLSLNVVARIIRNARCGEFYGCLSTCIIPSLLDAGLVFIIRWALDDSIDNSLTSAINALHALLVSESDEKAADSVFVWFPSCAVPSLNGLARQPSTDSGDKEEEQESDADVIKRDVIEGLLGMSLLERFSYLLDRCQLSATVVNQIVEILIRIARHSTQSAYQIYNCSRLLQVLFKNFLPLTWQPTDSQIPLTNVYGYPVPAVLKLMRVMASMGKNMASLLVAKYSLMDCVVRYVSQQPSELLLHCDQAHSLCIESWFTWQTLLQYGLGIDSFQLFPSLVLDWLSKCCVVNHQSDQPSAQIACAVVGVIESLLHSAAKPVVAKAGASTEPLLPTVNWNQVKGLHELMVSCCKRHLQQFVSSFFDTKYDLTLTACCLNYLSTYYSKVDVQPGYIAVDIQAEIDVFVEKHLLQCLTSPACSLALQYVRSHSTLLYECKPNTGTSEVALSLPGLGSLLEPGADRCPVLLQHGEAVQFVLALTRLLVTLSRLSRNVAAKASRYILEHVETLQYVRRVCQLPVCHLAANFFSKYENYWQYYMVLLARLKFLNNECSTDMAAYHLLALNLLPRLHPGDEHIAHDIMSNTAFNIDFLRDMSDAEQSLLQFDESLKLQNVAAMSTPTRQSVETSVCQLVQDITSHLSSIRSTYFEAAPATPEALVKSRQQFLSCSRDVESLVSGPVGQLLVPLDWVFLPLVGLYERAIASSQCTQITDGTQERVPPAMVAMVTNCLRAVYLLEYWRPTSLAGVSHVLKLSRLMCSFVAGSDLFLNTTVHQYLSALLRLYCKQVYLDRLDLKKPVPGLASFYDFYIQLVNQYEAVSFGDSLFACYVLLPLQQQHSVTYRMAVWGEHVTVLRSLSLPIKELMIPVERFLSPEESNVELLKLYLNAVLGGLASTTWCPVMYLIAVHHVNRFIYTIDSAHRRVKYGMIRQIVCSKDEIIRRHLLFYKRFNADCENAMELYDILPAIRLTTLEAAGNKLLSH